MEMTNLELVQQCFYHLNTFKRHRALANIKRNEGEHDKANFHELKEYQFLDNLELGLRAIQKSLYDEQRKRGIINASTRNQSDTLESD
jgi:hypothetical protein